MNSKYNALEPTFNEALGGNSLTFDTASTPSLFTSTSFLFTLSFVVIVVIASGRYAVAGLHRMEASQVGIKKSNEIFKRVTMGLLGVFSLWLILFTVNKDMLKGDVGLVGLRVKGSGVNGGTGTAAGTGAAQGTQGSTTGNSRSCDSPESVKTSLLSSGGVCGGVSCTILSGCNYQQYLPTIQSLSASAGINWKMIVVTMCKESRANKSAQNKNPNGTYDCGLMQINQSTPCDSNSLDPQTNIAKGVETMKRNLNSSSASRVYTNIPAEAGVFASYNCCANGTIPNAESSSCKTSDGWPTIPKWACPIDPGSGDYNMCSVKSYACELSVCLKEL